VISMPVYSPTMLAKGYLCSKRMSAFSSDASPAESKTTLDLNDPADLGTFKHMLMELWLEEVNQRSNFPITKKEQFTPLFKEFFGRSDSRIIKDKLSRKGVNIKDDFTRNYEAFIDNCKAEAIVIKLAISYEIQEILIETLQPGEGQIPLSEKHMISMKGYIDCIFICKETDFVVDWKSTLKKETNESHKIQLQSYLHIWRNLNSRERKVKGLLISLSDYTIQKAGQKVSKFEPVGEFDHSERESLILNIVDTSERPGSWCRYCKDNLVQENPCKSRSRDTVIQKNTQSLEDPTWTAKYIDVEIGISKFKRKNAKSQYFGYGENYQIVFVFPHAFGEEHFAGVADLRIRGSLKSKGSDRTFSVERYVRI
jgi:hypothetical protein